MKYDAEYKERVLGDIAFGGEGKMSVFEFMGFSYEAGGIPTMFVAHKEKYTVQETVEMCKSEFDYLFRNTSAYGRKFKALREPTVADVQEAYCAFRLGGTEWPDGCYTLVERGKKGAFPVYVIDFVKLEKWSTYEVRKQE